MTLKKRATTAKAKSREVAKDAKVRTAGSSTRIVKSDSPQVRDCDGSVAGTPPTFVQLLGPGRKEHQDSAS